MLAGDFLDRTENVLAFGNPGSGKTHLLCAIDHELILKGRRIYFTPCALLVQRLLRAKAELVLEKEFKRLDQCDALIVDDIGYIQHRREEMEVLFTLLAHRYERRSILITSSLVFSDWEKIFKDPMTTAAAIDRLVHHSVILELNLPSYEWRRQRSRKDEKSDGDTAVGNAASVDIPSVHGFPPLRGKAFGFTTFPPGRTAKETLKHKREFLLTLDKRLTRPCLRW